MSEVIAHIGHWHVVQYVGPPSLGPTRTRFQIDHVTGNLAHYINGLTRDDLLDLTLALAYALVSDDARKGR